MSEYVSAEMGLIIIFFRGMGAQGVARRQGGHL